MEQMIKETGVSSFHFTDEAAPPVLLREIAIEILKRNLNVAWWGNIRFEKAFSRDLCTLLAASGCAAVSGGLEVADERLLKLINKGVTLEQVARVCSHFRDAGILVHAYLMYGFPSQTEQEIINSLELVRQFIHEDLFQSAFWHLFTLTVHSPIAEHPQKYGITIRSSTNNQFANNDLIHIDETNIDYAKYSNGLRKALYNYMHRIGFEQNLQEWFEFIVPKTTIKKNYIKTILNSSDEISNDYRTIAVWLGSNPQIKSINKNNCMLTIHTNTVEGDWEVKPQIAEWLQDISIRLKQGCEITFSEVKSSYPFGEEDFELFMKSDLWQEIRENILLFV